MNDVAVTVPMDEPPPCVRLPWQSADIRFQPDRVHWVHEWFRLIAGAEREVVFVTYVWKFFQHAPTSPDSQMVLTPHVFYLGYALAEMQRRRRARGHQTKVRVTFLCNQDVWADRTSCRDNYVLSAHVWRRVFGVDISNITFAFWKQGVCDNMHSKFVVVDGHYTWLGSGNIENSHHSGPALWGESGATIASPCIAAEARRYAQRLFAAPQTCSVNVKCREALCRIARAHHFPLHATRRQLRTALYTIDLHSHTKRWSASKWEGALNRRLQRVDTCCTTGMGVGMSACRVKLLYSMPVRSVWTTRWAPEFLEILHCIRRARKSIYIFTPNFNDPTIWGHVRYAWERGVRVHICTGRNYNADISLVKVCGIGFCSNRAMWTRTVRPAWASSCSTTTRTRLQWRWYGYGSGGTFDGPKPREAHDKHILIDRHIVITGSFNCSVISTMNASEIVAVVDSPAFYKRVWDGFARERWEHAHPAE